MDWTNFIFCVLLAWLTAIVVLMYWTWHQSITMLLNININAQPTLVAPVTMQLPWYLQVFNNSG